MKNKISILIIILLTIFFVFLIACFGGKHTSYHYLAKASDVIQTSDGGFLAVGCKVINEMTEYICTVEEYYQSEIHFVKFTSSGAVEWEKDYSYDYYYPEGYYEEYGEEKKASTRGYSVAQTTDGGYIIAGLTGLEKYEEEFLDSNIYLLKIDSNGNEKWSKVLEGGSISAKSVYATNDNGFVIAGGSYYRVLKMNSEGKEEWAHISSYDGIAYKIIQDVDNNFISIGSIHLEGKKFSYILKLNSNGEVLWEKMYESYGLNNPYDPFPSSLTLTSTSYIVGITSEDEYIMLISIDSNGNEEWRETLDVKGGIYSIDYDNGYIISGRKYDDNQFYVAKFNTDRTKQWEYSIANGIAHSVKRTTDGGYIACGTFRDDETYYYVVKLNSNGIKQWEYKYKYEPD